MTIAERVQMGVVFVFVILGGLFLGAVVAVLTSSRAEGAVFMPVKHVDPPGAVKLIGQRWTAPGPGWTTANLWKSANATDGPALPCPPGDTCTAYVSVTQEPAQWRRVGQAIRLSVVDAAGDTLFPWSNYTLLAAGLPRDTLFLDACGARWLALGTDPPGYFAGWRRSVPNAVVPTIWQAAWVRDDGDSILVAPPAYPELAGRGPLVHFETLALALRCKLCALYGYIGLRGVRDSLVCDTTRVCP